MSKKITTVKELLEQAESISFAGVCHCGCGENNYDVQAPDGLIYPMISGSLMRKVRPDLIETHIPEEYLA